MSKSKSKSSLTASAEDKPVSKKQPRHVIIVGGEIVNAPKGFTSATESIVPFLALLVLFGAAMAMHALAGFILASAIGIKLGVLVMFPEGQKRSGRSGSVVWEKNDRMRVFAFPRLVRNSFTTAVRATFASYSSLWNSLTQPQQDSFLNANYPKGQNTMGHVVVNRGKQLYVNLNTNLFNIGSAAITTAPTPVSVNAPLVTAITADVSDAKITPAGISTSAVVSYLFWATARTSFGTNSPGKSRYKLLMATDTLNALSYAALYTAYQARYGTLVAGDCFFMYVTATNQATGQQSSASESFKIIVTA